MSPEAGSRGADGLRLSVVSDPIDRADVDIAVVTFYADERPLRGAAGRADWRLCGAVSRLIQRGKLSGAWGEAALIPSTGGLRSRWVLVLGLGSRDELDERRRQEIARVAVERALALGVGGSVALPLPPGSEDDPGVESRLDQVAEAMAHVAAAAPEAPAVHVRLVPRPEELPAVVEGLRRRARAPGPGGLHFEPPPAGPLAGSGRDAPGPAGEVRRGASPPDIARIPVK